MTTIDVQAEARVGYMYVHCQGVFTLEGMLQVYEHALDAAAREGRTVALLDVRDVKGGPPTIVERYEMGVHVAKLQSDPARRIRMAVVGHEPFIDPQRFGETVARNRGAISKVFTDIDEAIAWIEQRRASE